MPRRRHLQRNRRLAVPPEKAPEPTSWFTAYTTASNRARAVTLHGGVLLRSVALPPWAAPQPSLFRAHVQLLEGGLLEGAVRGGAAFQRVRAGQALPARRAGQCLAMCRGQSIGTARARCACAVAFNRQ